MTRNAARAEQHTQKAHSSVTALLLRLGEGEEEEEEGKVGCAFWIG